MPRPSPRRFLAALGGACVLVLAAVALAEPPQDEASTDAILAEIARSPRKDLVAEAVARAKVAHDRAARMRSAGDEPHARLADSVARTWAEAARDLLRAVDVEERAAKTRLAATDAGTQAERERALLEESIAQSGRLRAQIDGLQREIKDRPARTSITGADGGSRSVAPTGSSTGARGEGGAR